MSQGALFDQHEKQLDPRKFVFLRSHVKNRNPSRIGGSLKWNISTMAMTILKIRELSRYACCILVGAAFLYGCSTSRGAAGGTVLWDEAVNGDLGNQFGKPTIIPITQPGEYYLRVTTGPMIPVLRKEPAEIPGTLLDTLKRMDVNGDGRLQYAETRANFKHYFELYDLNDDGELEFSEVGQYGIEGDGHDIFDFDQATGINLVAIKVIKYDSGGIRNDASILVVIDEKSGRPRESRGVEITDKDLNEHTPFGAEMVAGVAQAGTEIYDQFKLWKAYRRNDSSCYFRIGEGQEKASMEFIFVFE